MNGSGWHNPFGPRRHDEDWPRREGEAIDTRALDQPTLSVMSEEERSFREWQAKEPSEKDFEGSPGGRYAQHRHPPTAPGDRYAAPNYPARHDPSGQFNPDFNRGSLPPDKDTVPNYGRPDWAQGEPRPDIGFDGTLAQLDLDLPGREHPVGASKETMGYFDRLTERRDPRSDSRMRLIERKYRGVGQRRSSPRVFSTVGQMGSRGETYFRNPKTGRMQEITRRGEQYEEFDRMQEQDKQALSRKYEEQYELLTTMAEEQKVSERTARFGRALAGAYGMDPATVSGLDDAQMKSVFSVTAKRQEDETKLEHLNRVNRQFRAFMKARWGMDLDPQLEPEIVDKMEAWAEDLQKQEESFRVEEGKRDLAKGESGTQAAIGALSPGGIMSMRQNKIANERQQRAEDLKTRQGLDALEEKTIGQVGAFFKSANTALGQVYDQLYKAPKPVLSLGADAASAARSSVTNKANQEIALKDHNRRKIAAFFKALATIQSEGAIGGFIPPEIWQLILQGVNEKHSNAFGDPGKTQRAFATALKHGGEPLEEWDDMEIQRIFSDPELLKDPGLSDRIDAMTREIGAFLNSKLLPHHTEGIRSEMDARRAR